MFIQFCCSYRTLISKHFYIRNNAYPYKQVLKQKMSINILCIPRQAVKEYNSLLTKNRPGLWNAKVLILISSYAGACIVSKCALDLLPFFWILPSSYDLDLKTIFLLMLAIGNRVKKFHSMQQQNGLCVFWERRLVYVHPNQVCLQKKDQLFARSCLFLSRHGFCSLRYITLAWFQHIGSISQPCVVTMDCLY